MRSIENTLALWVAGLLSAEQVKDCASAEIAQAAEPREELFKLVRYGPQECLKRAAHDFPLRPGTLSYLQEFSIRALAVSLSSNESALQFALWAARNCIGQELGPAPVQLGYLLDHLLDDCHDKDAAIVLVQRELPSLLAECNAIAQSFTETGA